MDKKKIITESIIQQDSTNYDSIAKHFAEKYRNNGFIAFSIDSFLIKENKIIYFCNKGFRYKLTKIDVSPPPYNRMSRSFIFKPIFSQTLLANYNKKYLNKVQNIGYPYAKLNETTLLNKNKITINYIVNAGNMILFDSVHTYPEGSISYNYISHLTGIRYNKPFNKSVLKNLKKSISNTSFISLDSAFITTDSTYASVILKTHTTPSNSFTGLIGLQTGSDNKTELTGNFSINLTNSFKQGEDIKLHWQKPSEGSQTLKAELSFPYIFTLPIGITLFSLFEKKDSLFSNSNILIGIDVPYAHYGKLQINAKIKKSVTTNNDTNINLSNSDITTYGISYSIVSFDNRLNPSNGFAINTSFAMGSGSLPDIYYEGSAILSFAKPILGGVIFARSTSAFMQNDSLKLNNLYRTGGANTFRGVNELSIYTRKYNYENIEYHYLINNSSYIFTFYDIGYFNEPTTNNYEYSTRQALGVGINIKTKAGSLSITYAIGKYKNTPYNINNGKIHIGYVSIF